MISLLKEVWQPSSLLVVVGVTVMSRPTIWYFYYISRRYGEAGERPPLTPLTSLVVRQLGHYCRAGSTSENLSVYPPFIIFNLLFIIFYCVALNVCWVSILIFWLAMLGLVSQSLIIFTSWPHSFRMPSDKRRVRTNSVIEWSWVTSETDIFSDSSFVIFSLTLKHSLDQIKFYQAISSSRVLHLHLQ